MSILQTTIDNIVAWGDARGFYGKGGTTSLKQGLKGIEEIGEVAKAYNKNDLEELKLEIGDVGVCGIHAWRIAQGSVDDVVLLRIVEYKDYSERNCAHTVNTQEKVLNAIQHLCYDLVNPYDMEVEEFLGDLAHLAELNGFTLEECLVGAYEKIKDRKGRMVNGVWVKEV